MEYHPFFDMRKPASRPAVFLLTVFLALSALPGWESASGEEKESTPRNPVQASKSAPGDVKSESRTLAELRAIGARRSRYATGDVESSAVEAPPPQLTPCFLILLG